MLTAAVMAAIAASVPAQLQFEELPRRGFPADPAPTSDMALGDVDGDGDLDMIAALSPGGMRLYVNDGVGSFTDVTATRLPLISGWHRTLATGDIDGDGDLDFFATDGNGTRVDLFVNNGNGVFADVTATQIPSLSPPLGSFGIAVGDVDNDGDLDLAVGRYDFQNLLLTNDGGGHFTDATATSMPIDTDSTALAQMGDVDGDGDLDLVFGNALSCTPYGTYGTGRNRLYLNDGTGTFVDGTSSNMPVVLDDTRAMALGDVDMDGDLDMVFANRPGSYFGCPPYDGLRLLLNDGSGAFSDAPSQLPPTSLSARAAEMGDADHDGDLDLAIGLGYTALLYLNDGTGTFIDGSTRIQTLSGGTFSFAFGDVDSDGDMDIAADTFGRDYMLFNLQRQLHAPVDLQIGQTYTLDAYMRYGPPSVSDFALPAVSFAPASVPLPPFGTLGLDPNQMIGLPLIVIPQPAGVGSLNLAIVNDPGLIGTAIHSQALLVPVTLQATLSNVVSDVLIQ